MEVQLVNLEVGKGFHLLEDEVFVTEMTGNVQHEAAVLETGIVEHRSAGLHLGEGLQGIEIAGLCIGLHAVALGRKRKLIGLFPGKSRKGGGLFGKGLPANLAGEFLRGIGGAVGRGQLNGSGYLRPSQRKAQRGKKCDNQTFHIEWFFTKIRKYAHFVAERADGHVTWWQLPPGPTGAASKVCPPGLSGRRDRDEGRLRAAW